MKTFTYKVYDNNDGFKGVLDNVQFVGFTKIINGGLGECILKVGESFSDFGEYDKIALNNYVEILVSDEDTAVSDDQKDVIIYSGYISKYENWMNGHQEGVNVYLLGYSTKLSQDLLKDTGDNKLTFYTNAASGISTTAPAAAVDVGEIVRALIDQYKAENSNEKISYTAETLDDSTGTTRTFTYEMMTYRKALDLTLSLAPSDWWWYIDADNLFHFKTKPTSPTHSFILGRHFSKVRIEKGMEKIKNRVLFWDGTNPATVCKLYGDDASLTDYDSRVEIMIDYVQRAAGATEADSISEAFITEHKDPDINVVVTIIDNNEDSNFGYDIESIEPGDTCQFLGFKEGVSDSFKENMLITRVDYTPNAATLTIEPMKMGVVPQVNNNSSNIHSIMTTTKDGDRAEDDYADA